MMKLSLIHILIWEAARHGSVDQAVTDFLAALNDDMVNNGFLTELLKSSYKDTGVSVEKDDKVLTLSTCSGDGLRFVVHAVRVDEHESGV